MESFWLSTPMDVMDAIDGYNDANRVGPKPMTRDRYEELKERYG